jgi:hypothetical protein
VAAALTVGLWSLAAVFLLTVRHRVPSSSTDTEGFDGPVVVFGSLAVIGAIAVAAAANYLRGHPFGSTFAVVLAVMATAAVAIVSSVNRDWQLQNLLTDFDPHVITAVILIGEAALVLAAVAIAASTRLGSVMTLLTCAIVLLAGLVSEYFLGSIVAGATNASPWARWLAWPFYAAIPNIQFFWTADALTQGQTVSLAHVAFVTLYAASMIVVLLSLAVALFQSRDVG